MMLPLFSRGPHRVARFRPPCGHSRARRARRAAARSVPDHARGRRRGDRLSPRPALRGARSGHRSPDLPPAAALRRGLLHLCARAAPERTLDRGAGNPAGVRDDGDGRGRGSRGDRPGLVGGLRAGRDRLADGRRGTRRDHAPRRRTAAARCDRRGREPDQRLDRPRPVSLRRGRGGVRLLFALGGRSRVHRERRRRPVRGPGGRLGDPPGPIADRRSAHRDHDLDPLGVRRLPARGGARTLGRDRGRYDRAVHGLVHAPAHHAGDAPSGRGGLGDPDLPAECGAVPARGPSAAGDPRRPLRDLDRRPGPVGRARERGRGRRPARVGVHAPVRAAIDRPPRVPASTEDSGRPAPRDSAGRACGARCRWPRRSQFH